MDFNTGSWRIEPPSDFPIYTSRPFAGCIFQAAAVISEKWLYTCLKPYRCVCVWMTSTNRVRLLTSFQRWKRMITTVINYGYYIYLKISSPEITTWSSLSYSSVKKRITSDYTGWPGSFQRHDINSWIQTPDNWSRYSILEAVARHFSGLVTGHQIHSLQYTRHWCSWHQKLTASNTPSHTAPDFPLKNWRHTSPDSPLGSVQSPVTSYYLLSCSEFCYFYVNILFCYR